MTVSKELALKMKAAGFPQESEHWWEYIKDSRKINVYRKSHIPKIVHKADTFLNGIVTFVAAPTVTEILAELPFFITIDKKGYKLKFEVINPQPEFGVFYSTRDNHRKYEIYNISTLEEALGEMYLQLKKEGIV